MLFRGSYDLNSEDREVISSLCGRNAIQITPADAKEIDLHELASKLEHLGNVLLLYCSLKLENMKYLYLEMGGL